VKDRIDAAKASANSLTVALTKLRLAPEADPAECIALANGIARVLSPEAPAIELPAPVAEQQAEAVPAEVAIPPRGKAPKSKE